MMSIVITLTPELKQLLLRREAILGEIQSNRSSSGEIHPLSAEFDELTRNIQMRLGNLAFEDAVLEATK